MDSLFTNSTTFSTPPKATFHSGVMCPVKYVPRMRNFSLLILDKDSLLSEAFIKCQFRHWRSFNYSVGLNSHSPPTSKFLHGLPVLYGMDFSFVFSKLSERSNVHQVPSLIDSIVAGINSPASVILEANKRWLMKKSTPYGQACGGKHIGAGPGSHQSDKGRDTLK